MTSAGHPWFPPCGDEVVLLPAGRRWDAVRAPMDIARWAFQILDGPENCAAIVDPRLSATYWLLPAGESDELTCEERLRPHITTLAGGSRTHYVGVPPAHHRTSPGPHWRIPEEWTGRYLAPARFLAAALTTAVSFTRGTDGAGTGPDRAAPPLRCPVCEGELVRAEAVRVTGRLHPCESEARPLHIHPTCAGVARRTPEGPR